MIIRGAEGDGTYIRKTLQRGPDGVLRVVEVKVVRPPKPSPSQRQRYSS